MKSYITIIKGHSLTTYIVESVIDLLLRNNGINISIIADICIEKSMVNGQHIFHK